MYEDIKLIKKLNLLPEVASASNSYNVYTDEYSVHIELTDSREIKLPVLPFTLLKQQIQRLY